MPLTEPCMKISLTRLFRDAPSVRRQRIKGMIDLRCRQRDLEIPTVSLVDAAFPLASTVQPFVCQTRCKNVESPQRLEVAANAIVAVMPDHLHPEHFPPLLPFEKIADTL